jgi:hypothetical protein
VDAAPTAPAAAEEPVPASTDPEAPAPDAPDDRGEADAGDADPDRRPD